MMNFIDSEFKRKIMIFYLSKAMELNKLKTIDQPKLDNLKFLCSWKYYVTDLAIMFHSAEKI